MGFSNWEGFQLLAEKLVKIDEEAILRSAISRSYFAAFNISVNFAEINLNFVRQRGREDHREVSTIMYRRGDSVIRRESRRLDRLRHKRERADYEERTNINKQEAECSVQIADKIIQALKSWTQNP